MLLRLIALIFVLNTFAPAAIASFDCDMMSDSDMAAMSHDMSDQSMSVIELECSMNQDDACKSTQCITTCAASLPLLSLESKKSFSIEILNNHPKDILQSLYKIFLPIKTPPPLA